MRLAGGTGRRGLPEKLSLTLFSVDPLPTSHPEYLALGAGPTTRASAYRAVFADALPAELVRDTRGCLQQQKALGTGRFRAWVEARIGRFATARPIGRPPRRSNCPRHLFPSFQSAACTSK